MKVKHEEIKRCGKCGKSDVISESTYACDGCGKALSGEKVAEKNVSAYDPAGGDTTQYHFCSWSCLRNKLEDIVEVCDYFISLPYVQCDNRGKTDAKEFLSLFGLELKGKKKKPCKSKKQKPKKRSKK